MTDDEAKRRAREIDDEVIRRQPQLARFPNSERVLEIARYLVGTGEIVEPQKRNDGVPRWLFCAGEWNTIDDCGYAWCAAFVSYCHARALNPIPGTPAERRAMWAVAAMFAKAKQLDKLLPANTLPSPGDVMFLWGRRGSDRIEGDSGIHHCGIVETADAARVYTIEGNFGNKLARTSRANTDPAIAGYARF